MLIHQQTKKIKQNKGGIQKNKKTSTNQGMMFQPEGIHPTLLRRAIQHPRAAYPDTILQLQWLYGNRALNRMIAEDNMQAGQNISTLEETPQITTNDKLNKIQSQASSVLIQRQRIEIPRGGIRGGIKGLETEELKTLARVLTRYKNILFTKESDTQNDQPANYFKSNKGKLSYFKNVLDFLIGLIWFVSRSPDLMSRDQRSAWEDALFDWLLSSIIDDIPKAVGEQPAPFVQVYLLQNLQTVLKEFTSEKVTSEEFKVKKYEKEPKDPERTSEFSDWESYQVQTHRFQKDKIGLLKTRVFALLAFYNSMLPDDQAPGVLPKQKPVSLKRQAMVAHALAEVGKTDCGKPEDTKSKFYDTGPGNSNRKARAGWRHLRKYFDMVGLEEVKDTQLAFGVIPHWCGIFTFYAAKMANMPVPNWKIGASALAHLNTTKTPQVGDIVMTQKGSHHGIIVWIERGKKDPAIETVEGNQWGGKIVRRRTTLGQWIKEAVLNPEDPK